MMKRRSRAVQSSSEDPHGVTSVNVRRALAGDAEGLEWVIRRLSPVLLAQVSYRVKTLRGVIDPEDLLQDAWLKTLPRLGDLRPQDGRITPVLLKFMTTIVNRRIRDLLQKQVAGAPLGQVGEAAEEGAAATSGVISRVIREETRDQVREALRQLPAADRDLVILRGIEQNSLGAVAAVLEISSEAARKRYRRVLEQLRLLVPDSVFAELSDAD